MSTTNSTPHNLKKEKNTPFRISQERTYNQQPNSTPHDLFKEKNQS